MPTSKRPSSRAAESEPDPKRVETDQTNNTTNDNDSGSETPDEATLEALENEFEPYEYVCLNIPPYGRDTDEDDEDQDPEENSDDDLHKKPASEHPDHKFIIPWSAFKKYHDYCRFATYVDPDAFDMYIYNDYQAYGTIQLVENAYSSTTSTKQ
ncbi:uncharacterized protein RCC_01879 [Ramularia collo-cygni]|uniref:Uncharacterized protein n=1 Tax=Ramularia collo-cygni TaxID=112498 RepID=A0A2D3V3F9_9PEZI|nr:uncharacterized protein RCC_01879 [Ramularia collo-cygni]CZT16039.1 uncharacterized protein RCC_01879 [Ramularia collo-cygni]